MRSSRAYGTAGRRSHCRAWRALLMCRFAGLHNASTGAHLRVQRARAQERCASQCVGRTALTSTKLSSRHLCSATGDAYDEVWLQRPQPLERAPFETPFSQKFLFDYKIGIGSLRTPRYRFWPLIEFPIYPTELPRKNGRDSIMKFCVPTDSAAEWG